ncbi:uncharacterized protein FFB20_03777 [Fusarium fujikuroi]|nr:uncharacterized protein FFE2_01789 [Fusarium fujikuroi]SCN70507.1 uncharacterized protein FFB20_03777 [Fusarium fujikuroi]SCO15615.1 uncharacterized protein FFC1_12546 [Fusarium fujikuroi]SCO50900.1 uncharacterized protein FFNC_13476 [Fusarium fujikuroi]SCV55232.1 uncharacterized protein FFFS_11653 [Fusarium fujikuroi]
MTRPTHCSVQCRYSTLQRTTGTYSTVSPDDSTKRQENSNVGGQIESEILAD